MPPSPTHGGGAGGGGPPLAARSADRLDPQAGWPERRPDDPILRADERRRDGPALRVAVAVSADALLRRLGVIAQHAQQVGHADRAAPLLHDLGRPLKAVVSAM